MFQLFNVFGRPARFNNYWCHYCKMDVVKRIYGDDLQTEEEICAICNSVLENINGNQNIQEHPRDFNIYRDPHYQESQLQLNNFYSLTSQFNRPNIVTMIEITMNELEEEDKATEQQINSLEKQLVQENNSIQECQICQEDIKIGETQLKMPCNHPFHENCLTSWLKVKNSCPVCRAQIN